MNYPETDFGPCINCGDAEWAAKNKDYCSSCAEQYLEAYRQTICPAPNPYQLKADEILHIYYNAEITHHA